MRYFDPESELDKLQYKIKALKKDIKEYIEYDYDEYIYKYYEDEYTPQTEQSYTKQEFLDQHCGGLDLNKVVEALKEKYPENFV